MKLIKLTAVSAAILGSTAAMAADPIVVVDDNDTVAYPVAAPAYQYIHPHHYPGASQLQRSREHLII